MPASKVPGEDTYGITLDDGTHYPLDQQPPVAHGGQWWPPTKKAP